MLKITFSWSSDVSGIELKFSNTKLLSFLFVFYAFDSAKFFIIDI